MSGPVLSDSISQRTVQLFKKKGSANVLTFNGRRTIITRGSAPFAITVAHSHKHTRCTSAHAHICKITDAHHAHKHPAPPPPPTRSSSSAYYTLQEVVAMATNTPESTISPFRSDGREPPDKVCEVQFSGRRRGRRREHNETGTAGTLGFDFLSFSLFALFFQVHGQKIKKKKDGLL